MFHRVSDWSNEREKSILWIYNTFSGKWFCNINVDINDYSRRMIQANCTENSRMHAKLSLMRNESVCNKWFKQMSIQFKFHLNECVMRDLSSLFSELCWYVHHPRSLGYLTLEASFIFFMKFVYPFAYLPWSAHCSRCF